MKDTGSSHTKKTKLNKWLLGGIALVVVLAIILAVVLIKGGVFTQKPEKDNSLPASSQTVLVEEVDNSFEIKLSFAGDNILACFKNITTSGSFNEYSNKKDPSYFLEKVKPIFEQDDFTFVNLENVLTDKNLSPVPRNYSPAFWFRSKTSNINILTSASVEGVSLTNNHTNDYGSEGYNDTLETVKNAGLEYGTQSKTVYYTKNDYTVAIICSGMWYEGQSADIIKRLNEASEKSDFQAVFFHGGTEKIHKPDNFKVRAAHKLVDAGADLVVGSHPHVLQPREVYKGVEIVYSLGNFCYGGHRRPENRCVIYQATLKFDKDGVYTGVGGEIIPCYVYTGSVNNYQPTPIENEKEKQRVLDFMDGKVSSPL